MVPEGKKLGQWHPPGFAFKVDGGKTNQTEGGFSRGCWYGASYTCICTQAEANKPNETA